MVTEKELRARIGELETELDSKEHEIIAHLDRIEQLEDQLLRLEAAYDEDESGKKKGSKVKSSKITIELEEKDKKIRELKDKLGYLRKEKISLQQEIEKISKDQDNSSVIRIEEKKTPLDTLVNDLQTKINKQRLLITKLKQKAMDADSAELNEKIREKDEKIKELETKLQELGEKKESKAESRGGADAITRALTEELQTKLNKAKRQITVLNDKLKKFKKKGKGKVEITSESEMDSLQEKIDELTEQIENKNKKIANLEETLSCLEEEKEEKPDSGAIGALTEELQTKLNKAKIQIKTLQEQLKEREAGTAPEGGASSEEIEEELRTQRDLVVGLQQKIDELQQTLENKDGEITSVKNEAIQHKIKCEDLENAVKLKEAKIEELKTQLSKVKTSSPSPAENPDVALRVRELKNMIEDLNKQSIQQRLEISQLRKT